jgi:hypothetical protein
VGDEIGVGGQCGRFDGIRINPCCGDPTFVQCFGKCLFIYHSPSSGVNQDRTLLHRSKLLLSDETAGTVEQRDVEREDVDVREHIVHSFDLLEV